MTGRRLQRLSVMHQRLDRVSILGACELFALCLSPRNDRDRQIFLDNALVHFPHHLSPLFRLFVCGMDRMSFLPEELSGTQERSCRLLPAEHRAPLIPHFRKIAVGLNRLAPHIAEQSLRCRTDTESLLELFHSSMGDPCDLRSESLDMVLLFLQQALRDQDRKIDILHSCLLES